MGHKRLTILSLGAGVQSSVLALMAARGEVEPMPDAAIFADTGWEPPRVYAHLRWLTEQLPFPVHVVSAGNLREALLAPGRVASAPFYTAGGGTLRRQCTKEYKLDPIRRQIRQLAGLKKGQRAGDRRAEVWIGISLEEIQRMKASPDAWVTHRFPLVEMRMRRGDCLEWIKRRGLPEPPRSACIGCPYHNTAAWREMKRSRPEDWADAVEVDEAIRNGLGGVNETLYLHRSLRPLSEVDLSNDRDRGQMTFLDECDGMCGT